MPKRKEDAPSQTELSASDGSGEQTPRPKKIILKVDDSGNILWDEVSEAHKRRFAESVATDATALEMIGLASAEQTAPPMMTIDRSAIPTLYDGVAMVISSAGRIFLKWPRDLCVLMKYSDAQKERLKEPTAKVIEKRAPKWLIENQDVVALALAFASCTKEMVENAVIVYATTHQPPQQPVNGKEVTPSGELGQA